MIHKGLRAVCSEPGCNKDYSNISNLRRHHIKVHEPEYARAERREERQRQRDAEAAHSRALAEENKRLKEELSSFLQFRK